MGYRSEVVAFFGFGALAVAPLVQGHHGVVLGAPIRHRGEHVGNLYLSDKEGGLDSELGCVGEQVCRDAVQFVGG